MSRNKFEGSKQELHALLDTRSERISELSRRTQELGEPPLREGDFSRLRSVLALRRLKDRLLDRMDAEQGRIEEAVPFLNDEHSTAQDVAITFGMNRLTTRSLANIDGFINNVRSRFFGSEKPAEQTKKDVVTSVPQNPIDSLPEAQPIKRDPDSPTRKSRALKLSALEQSKEELYGELTQEQRDFALRIGIEKLSLFEELGIILPKAKGLLQELFLHPRSRSSDLSAHYSPDQVHTALDDNRERLHKMGFTLLAEKQGRGLHSPQFYSIIPDPKALQSIFDGYFQEYLVAGEEERLQIISIIARGYYEGQALSYAQQVNIALDHFHLIRHLGRGASRLLLDQEGYSSTERMLQFMATDLRNGKESGALLAHVLSYGFQGDERYFIANHLKGHLDEQLKLVGLRLDRTKRHGKALIYKLALIDKDYTEEEQNNTSLEEISPRRLKRLEDSSKATLGGEDTADEVHSGDLSGSAPKIEISSLHITVDMLLLGERNGNGDALTPKRAAEMVVLENRSLLDLVPLDTAYYTLQSLLVHGKDIARIANETDKSKGIADIIVRGTTPSPVKLPLRYRGDEARGAQERALLLHFIKETIDLVGNHSGKLFSLRGQIGQWIDLNKSPAPEVVNNIGEGLTAEELRNLFNITWYLTQKRGLTVDQIIEILDSDIHEKPYSPRRGLSGFREGNLLNLPERFIQG